MANINNIPEKDQHLLDQVAALHRESGDWKVTGRRGSSEPLELYRTIRGIGKNICDICRKGPYVTHTFRLKCKDTGVYEVIPKVCKSCLKILNQKTLE